MELSLHRAESLRVDRRLGRGHHGDAGLSTEMLLIKRRAVVVNQKQSVLLLLADGMLPGLGHDARHIVRRDYVLAKRGFKRAKTLM